MTIEYVSIGEITLDDIVFETGEVMRSQTGGGAIYSALGMKLWGHSVGINAVVGQDYPESSLQILIDHRISIEGIARKEGWSLRLWLLHEENNKKQQLPKLQSANLYDLDKARPELPDSYLTAKGFHLAPTTSEAQIRSRDSIRRRNPNALISLDILVAPFINLKPYSDGSAFTGVQIFSPSIVEIETLLPGKSMDEVFKVAEVYNIHWVSIKMDTRGSLVYDAHKNQIYHIPIYPVNAIDSTGAGDAYSGGFLTGIAETGDVVEAALRGTVSASFAVQQLGALEMLQATRKEAEERLVWLRGKITRINDEHGFWQR